MSEELVVRETLVASVPDAFAQRQRVRQGMHDEDDGHMADDEMEQADDDEMEQAGDAPKYVEGMAAGWNVPVFHGDPEYGHVVMEMPGCADYALASGKRTDFNLDHEGIPLATTANGTLELWADNSEYGGLMFRAQRAEGSALAAEVFLAIQQGRLREASVYFFGDVLEHTVYEAQGEEDAKWDGAHLIKVHRFLEIIDVCVTARGLSRQTNYDLTLRHSLPVRNVSSLLAATQTPLTDDSAEAAEAAAEIKTRLGGPPPPPLRRM